MLTTRIAAGALALVLAAAGCSSITSSTGDTSASSAAPSSAAAKRSRPAPGSTVDAAEFSATLKKTMESITSAKTTIETETNGATTTMTGVADLKDKAKPMTQTTTESSTGKAEMITVGTTVYTKAPNDTKWKKTTPTTDLSSLTASLALTFSSVTYVGTDTIDGEEVDQYDVEVTLGEMKVPSTLYLDQQGRTRRIVTNVETGVLKGKNVTTMSNYNEPVSIKEPPASEVEE